MLYKIRKFTDFEMFIQNTFQCSRTLIVLFVTTGHIELVTPQILLVNIVIAANHEI